MTQISSSAFSTAQPMSFARGRNGDIYGINGEDRGLRWDGVTSTVEQIGITAPAAAPTITSTATSPKYFLAGVDVLDGGYGYKKEPKVTFSGGSGSGAAAKASLTDSRVGGIALQQYGTGYTSAPTVTVGAPDGAATDGSGATFTVVLSGRVVDILPTNFGSGYTVEPTVTISAPPSGVTALCTADVNGTGGVSSISIANPGSGYTSTPTVTFTAPGTGTTATGTAVVRYEVVSVTVTAGGTGYSGTPRLQFVSPKGGGAAADCIVNSSGVITGVTLLHGGSYETAPTASVAPSINEQPRTAKLSAIAQAAIKGKYWCAIRYVDDTSVARGGPIPSSVSELTSIELADAAGSLNWSWSNTGMEARVSAIELWRTTADQAKVLYRVATVAKTATSYTDTIGDSELVDPERMDGSSKAFGALPVTLPNGQVSARRFVPPPRNKRVMVMFQDRAWYAVDVAGKKFDGTSDSTFNEPNAIYFSEVDEPESVPEVNQLVIQENVRGTDRVTALMPFAAGMVVFQNQRSYRLSYVSQPIIDASVSLICQRGCLNQRCWDTYDGVAYVVDSAGMYVLDGTQAVPLSDAVDTYWTKGVIDFSSSKWFFVRVDPATRVARFFFSVSGVFPDRALCYHPLTKAWWEERYAQRFGAGETCTSGYRQKLMLGGQAGAIVKADSGASDLDASATATPIQCTIRTGNFPVDPKGDSRSIRVLYNPTTAACSLALGLHYNNSATARPAAVMTDRGSGFVTDSGGNATLNLALSRSSLGDATGYATCWYAGRLDDRSAGADRHLAVALSVTRPSDEPLVIHGLAVEGVAE